MEPPGFTMIQNLCGSTTGWRKEISTMIKYVIAILPSVILIILGISIKYFKAYWLISGYNTMSKEKKMNVDVENLGRSMGNFCFVLSGLIFLFIISLYTQVLFLTILVAVILIASIIVFIIKAQKFDGNALNPDGKYKKSTKIVILVTIGFLLLVFSGVGIQLYQSNLPVTYIVSNDALQIKGMYGETIKYTDIINISITESLPEITLRTNGSAVGSKLKGYFNVTGYEDAKLFIDTKIPPFIIMKTDSGSIIFNCEDRTKTQNLYEKLKSKSE